MSSAKQCDRCNQLYSPTAFLNDTTGEWWRFSVSKDCHPYPERRFDLCPECKKKLAKWMKGGEGE